MPLERYPGRGRKACRSLLRSPSVEYSEGATMLKDENEDEHEGEGQEEEQEAEN